MQGAILQNDRLRVLNLKYWSCVGESSSLSLKEFYNYSFVYKTLLSAISTLKQRFRDVFDKTRII